MSTTPHEPGAQRPTTEDTLAIATPADETPATPEEPAVTVHAPEEQTAADHVPGQHGGYAAPGQPVPPEVRTAPVITGPNPAAIIVGLLGLVTLIYCILQVTTDVVVNWRLTGPALVIGIGAVIVGLGIRGIRSGPAS